MSVTDDIHGSRRSNDKTRQPRRRPIRSFVRREGRLTRAQSRALEELWPRYGIDHPGGRLDLVELFGREAPHTLEVGFGNGDVLFRHASQHPERDFLGIEVHRPGVGRLLNRLAGNDLDNVRVLCADAVEVLCDRLPPGSLDACWIFFPDPWPKKRHHKRRLIQPVFAAALAGILKPGGIIHLATDWPDYADHMLSVMDNVEDLQNVSGKGRYADRPEWRPPTRFELRGRERGHAVYDLIYRKRESPAT